MLRLSVTGKVNTLLGRFDHGELRACYRFCVSSGPPTSLVSKGRKSMAMEAVVGRQRRENNEDKRRQTGHVGNVILSSPLDFTKRNFSA